MAEEATPKTVEILLTIQHALLRESLGRLLSSGFGFRVAAPCASIHEALDVLERAAIDVVLLDLDFGKQFSREFVRSAKGRGFKGKVLLLATEINRDDVAELLRAGICGICHKSDPPALLEHAIRDVAAGNAWFKQEQLQVALNGDADARPGTRNDGGFTKRERAVLSLVSEGLTNREIGAQIGVSEGSVKGTLQQLFSKFGVRSRSRLVRIVLEQHRPKA
jgi:two-component system, NarL family, nitrate/nitrite response regulator NarL